LRFTVVHAADLHLDTPCSGLGRTAPAVADALREASLESFDRLVELCLDEQAAILLLAGDVYDGPERGIRAERRLLGGLARLGDAGVRTFIVHGNHDPLAGHEHAAALPAGSFAFPADQVLSVPVEWDGVEIATVHGISFREREERRNLARLFQASGPGMQIGVLHANVGDPEHAAYAPCSVEDLRSAGMDYWALGHVHRRLTVLAGGPWAAYPGVLQGRSPAPGERGAKGAFVLSCDAALGLLAPPRFVALDRIRFAEIAVDVSELDSAQAVLDRLEAAAAAERDAADGRALVLRGVLSGAYGQDEELHRAQAEMLQSLQESGLALAPFVWWDALDVQTHPPLRREEVLAGSDLAAEVLREVDRLALAPAELLAMLGELDQSLMRLPVRDALGRRREPEELLRAAEDVCLRLLVGGGGQ